MIYQMLAGMAGRGDLPPALPWREGSRSISCGGGCGE